MINLLRLFMSVWMLLQGPAVPGRTGAVISTSSPLISACHTGVWTTSGQMNCTGATLFWAVSCRPTNANVAPSDSSSNTWTADPNGPYGTSGTFCQAYFVCGPTVTTTQTVTDNSGSGSTVIFAAFSGTATTACRDGSSGAATINSNSVQPGSVTPTQTSGELALNAVTVSNSGDTVTIDSGTKIELASTFSPAMWDAYIITNSSSALNPTWSDSSGNDLSIPTMMVFKHP